MSEVRHRLTMADIMARRAPPVAPPVAPVVAPVVATIASAAPAATAVEPAGGSASAGSADGARIKPTKRAKPPGRWGRLRAEIGSDTVNRLIIDFTERWPGAFTSPPRPLTIGIHHAIVAAMNDDPRAIALAMHDWTARAAYQAALAAGGPRYDLDGTPNGAVSDSERAAGADYIASRIRQTGLPARRTHVA